MNNILSKCQKIRIVMGSAEEKDTMFKLLDNLPVLLADIICSFNSGNRIKENFNKETIPYIELKLEKIKIPLGYKITFE